MKVKLLADMNISPVTVGMLNAAGWDTLRVSDTSPTAVAGGCNPFCLLLQVICGQELRSRFKTEQFACVLCPFNDRHR